MRNFFLLLVISFLSVSCTRHIYIVRHAEKAAAADSTVMMSNDPPLTDKGKARAETLREVLKTKKIGHIFSTNTIRTRTTAEPTCAFFGLAPETYSPQPDDAFITRLRSLKKNALVVGHSNTVDDIVNKLCGAQKIPGDLDESQYDNLYILRKKGNKIIFENKKYGEPTPLK